MPTIASLASRRSVAHEPVDTKGRSFQSQSARRMHIPHRASMALWPVDADQHLAEAAKRRATIRASHPSRRLRRVVGSIPCPSAPNQSRTPSLDALLDSWIASVLPLLLRNARQRHTRDTCDNGREVIFADNSVANWALALALSGQVTDFRRGRATTSRPTCRCEAHVPLSFVARGPAMHGDLNRAGWKVCHIDPFPTASGTRWATYRWKGSVSAVCVAAERIRHSEVDRWCGRTARSCGGGTCLRAQTKTAFARCGVSGCRARCGPGPACPNR